MRAVETGATALALLVALLLPAPSLAATFRCGNVYQDRPCDGAVIVQPPPPAPVPGLSVSPRSAVPAPAPAPSPGYQSAAARECTRMGEEAQRLAWKREGGASREDQLAPLANTRGSIQGRQQEALVQDVYRRSGSAMEIRTAVEAECRQRLPAAKPASARDPAVCAMLRDAQARLERQSHLASGDSQRELFRQARQDLNDRLVAECGG